MNQVEVQSNAYTQKLVNRAAALGAAMANAAAAAAASSGPNAVALGVGGMDGQTSLSLAAKVDLSHNWTATASLAGDPCGGSLAYGAGTAFSW